MATTQLFINWLMDKQKWGIAMQWNINWHKKDLSTDICYHTDELWKHAQWKKPVTKEHILYDFIDMKYPA